MPIVPLNQVLHRANQGKYAVGAFNINNDLQAQAIFKAAYDLKSPVIVQASKGAIAFQAEPNDPENPTLEELARGAERIADIARTVTKAYPDLNYVLHLDHGPNLELSMACVEAGFSSIMIDGSHLPLDENIELTKSVVDAVRAYGSQHHRYISVEGEIGTMGGMSHTNATGEITYACPEEALKFVRETEVDALAISWGTRHGPNKGLGKELDLRPEVIRDCSQILEDNSFHCYIVSHGSSTVPQQYVDQINKYGGKLDTTGIPPEMVQKAIEYGATKVNIDTDLRLAMTGAVRQVLVEKTGTIDPRDYLRPARQAMYETVSASMRLLGSVGKA